ncbi:uncharacterized protein LOC144453021 [Glandiceps talaboti]
METKDGEDKRDPILPEDMLNIINQACQDSNSAKMASVMRPGGEVDVLLLTTVALSKTGMDKHSEMTKVFMEKSLIRIFRWIHDDYDQIKRESMLSEATVIDRLKQLMELVVIKLHDDYLPLLNLLAITLNPSSRFYACSEFNLYNPVPSDAMSHTMVYAKSEGSTKSLNTLVHMINLFGKLEGFKIILERFEKAIPCVPVIAAMLRPFGQCYEYLTEEAVNEYFIPVLTKSYELLENLSDEELSEYCESEDLAIGDNKPDAINTILIAIESLSSRVPPGNDKLSIDNIELFRMRMTLRLKHARGLPYGRCALSSMNNAENPTTVNDDVTGDSNKPDNSLETTSLDKMDNKATDDAENSDRTKNSYITEVTVRQPGFTATDTIVDIPQTPLSEELDDYSAYDLHNNSDDETFKMEVRVDELKRDGAACSNAMPNEDGEHFSTFFDIAPIPENCSRHTSGRWSANSSDISGTTSKTYSVRSNGHDLCRFCYEADQVASNRMIKPCNCSGSAAYVHTRCLKKWIHFSRNTQCEVCHTNFSYIPYSERIRAFLEEFRRNKKWRNATFATLVGLVVLLYLVIFAVFPGGIIDV